MRKQRPPLHFRKTISCRVEIRPVRTRTFPAPQWCWQSRSFGDDHRESMQAEPHLPCQWRVRMWLSRPCFRATAPNLPVCWKCYAVHVGR